MANNEDKLSRLYREGLGDFAKDPPRQVWSGIKQGLLIKKLVALRFLTTLNIYSVAVFVMAAAIAGFFVGKELQQKNETVTSAKNISTIINTIPSKPEKIQHLKLEQNNAKLEQNIETAKVNVQQEIILRKEIQNKIQTPPANIQSNAFSESFKPTNKQEPYLNTVKNPPSQLNNGIKPPEVLTEKPIIIGSSKMLVNEINPIVPEKQPSRNDIINKEETKVSLDQPTKQSEPTIETIKSGKPKTTQGFYAEIFGAPSLLTYKFDQSSVNPNLTFVNNSKNDEKPALSYTAGLELGYGLKHLFAQTGINYSDYRSTALIDLRNSYLIKTITLNKIDSVFIPDSLDPHYEFMYDTIRDLTQRDTLISQRATNSLRYVEIPILVGYRFYSKRMSFAVLGGISIGYLSSSGGKTLNPDLKSVSVNTTEAVPFKSWTYYLVFRAEAAYLIKKDFSIFIRPGFKYNMNSVFEDYYPVQKTFYTLDLHLGLRYNF